MRRSSLMMFLLSEPPAIDPRVQANPKISPKLGAMRKFSRSFMRSPVSSPPRSPAATLSISCDLSLLSTLQGASISCEDRQRVARDIESMSNIEKDQLIEFLEGKNGAVESAVENNACKQFVCSPSEISCELLLEKTNILLSLWTQLYQEIIPAMQGILYPLKRHHRAFDIRKCVLTAFRDRVLAKMLKDCGKVSEIESMLFTILLETQNDTKEYSSFSILANKAMRGEEPVVASRMLVKTRSKTLPNKSNKSVTWQDMRKSATFSH